MGVLGLVSQALPSLMAGPETELRPAAPYDPSVSAVIVSGAKPSVLTS